jgi:copper resistance protein B
MNNLKPLAQLLLCTLFPLSGAAFAQEPMSMPMSGHDMPTSGSDSSMKNMGDMPGMDKPVSKPAPATQPAPPVGSLPSSDGSAGKSYAAYGIDMDSMHMEDDPLIAKLLLDKLEYVHGRHDSMVWDGRFRFGRDLNQLWIRSEGQQAKGKIQDAEAELLWGHTFSPFWTVMTGVRHDFGTGPSRDWAALGVQGLAPYKFDVEATAYVGSSGRTALKLKASYDLLLTQRLILSPEVDANLYSKDDLARGVGAGLSDTSLGVRLRYEIRREFAPYIGFNAVQKYGKTADFSRAEGAPTHDFQLVTGVRIWF